LHETVDEAAGIVIAPMAPSDPRARQCLLAYFAELDERFPAGFAEANSIPLTDEKMSPPHGVLLVATRGGEPLGCGALTYEEGQPPYLKRMWISPSARGFGLGRRMLAALETVAREHGAGAVRLETNASLVEAIALYRASGYVEVEPFNDEPYAHHWFVKSLA
jgi:GNAT superfamily N-acetyltransferase